MITLLTLLTLITLVTLVILQGPGHPAGILFIFINPITLTTIITLVILVTLITLITQVTLVTLVSLFQSPNQIYRAECITVSGFFFFTFQRSISFYFLEELETDCTVHTQNVPHGMYTKTAFINEGSGLKISKVDGFTYPFYVSLINV